MRFNKVLVGGFVGADPVVKYLEGTGKPVAQFNLAVDESYTDKNGNKVEATEWFRIVAWEKNAEFVEKYVKKGSPLLIEGRLKTETYEDQKVIMPDGTFLKRSTTKVIVSSIQFAGNKPEQAQQATAVAQATTAPQTYNTSAPMAGAMQNPVATQQAQQEYSASGDDDLPF